MIFDIKKHSLSIFIEHYIGYHQLYNIEKDEIHQYNYLEYILVIST